MSGLLIDQTTRALGMSIVSDCIELHGLNLLGEVVLHGWFPHEAGVSILCRQPKCMIALNAQSVSEQFAKTLEAMGHSTILVDGYELDDQPRRSAKALAQIAMSAVRKPSPTRKLIASGGIPLS